jgi:hypothetical protein
MRTVSGDQIASANPLLLFATPRARGDRYAGVVLRKICYFSRIAHVRAQLGGTLAKYRLKPDLSYEQPAYWTEVFYSLIKKSVE